MLDPRIKELAHNLITYSVDLQPGERVLIEAIGIDNALTCALVQEAYKAGGLPFVQLQNNTVLRALQMGCTDEQLSLMARLEGERMANMQAYIGVRGGDNMSELSDVPPSQQERYQRLYWEPVHGRIRVPRTKWVVLRYPNPAMAQLAGTSTEQFEDYYFAVCNLNYAKMSAAMDALVALMERTDRVRLTGRDTDLRFSIKGIPAIKCDGRMNIPDGEVFTAPVKDSVEGHIAFNTPSLEAGFTFQDIRLEFQKGKIVRATANDEKRINSLLDTDAGARYVGEFAIGVNPYITRPMRDTLFDEKIAGSFHFTPGACYDEAPNGNASALHWDLVFIQTPEYGGGEMYFDDVLVRKDGIFVLPELEPLNPENLK
ncbi:aminopeptidase [Christensenellaceae bacterium NSJ-44]|uniref:Aminopeptidase n=1 Tax=Luoshenia tenuis TaxID=2763654 RepID=A0A926HJC7_9FIRM|nr:aminopeptidase [Luoshenia tenuis]MBC8529757.1 aminopeptidase [Luoshenia tenuis]